MAARAVVKVVRSQVRRRPSFSVVSYAEKFRPPKRTERFTGQMAHRLLRELGVQRRKRHGSTRGPGQDEYRPGALARKLSLKRDSGQLDAQRPGGRARCQARSRQTEYCDLICALFRRVAGLDLPSDNCGRRETRERRSRTKRTAWGKARCPYPTLAHEPLSEPAPGCGEAAVRAAHRTAVTALTLQATDATRADR